MRCGKGSRGRARGGGGGRHRVQRKFPPTPRIRAGEGWEMFGMLGGSGGGAGRVYARTHLLLALVFWPLTAHAFGDANTGPN